MNARVVVSQSLQQSRPAVQQEAIPATRAIASCVRAAMESNRSADVSHHDDSHATPASHSPSQSILSTPSSPDVDAKQCVEHYQRLHQALDADFQEYAKKAFDVSQDSPCRCYLLQ